MHPCIDLLYLSLAFHCPTYLSQQDWHKAGFTIHQLQRCAVVEHCLSGNRTGEPCDDIRPDGPACWLVVKEAPWQGDTHPLATMLRHSLRSTSPGRGSTLACLCRLVSYMET